MVTVTQAVAILHNMLTEKRREMEERPSPAVTDPPAVV